MLLCDKTEFDILRWFFIDGASRLESEDTSQYEGSQPNPGYRIDIGQARLHPLLVSYTWAVKPGRRRIAQHWFQSPHEHCSISTWCRQVKSMQHLSVLQWQDNKQESVLAGMVYAYLYLCSIPSWPSHQSYHCLGWPSIIHTDFVSHNSEGREARLSWVHFMTKQWARWARVTCGASITQMRNGCKMEIESSECRGEVFVVWINQW